MIETRMPLAPRRAAPPPALTLTSGIELHGDATIDRPVLLPELCLLLCDAGSGIVGPGRQPFPELAMGQLLVRTPAQVRPRLAGDERTRARIILIDPELLASLGEGDGRRLPRFHSLLTTAPELLAAVRALWDAVARGAPLAEQHDRLRPCVRAVLRAFTAGGSRAAPLTPAVARARELLHERFADELRLDWLSRSVGMSKCHLVHLFHRELGMPPHAYQIQLRVAYARRLVASGMALAEVASLTGFADQSHLTRLFKRIVGMPPGQYALQALG